MNTRKMLARGIGVVGLVAALMATWQSVRFCQGEIWSPLVLAGNYVSTQLGGGEWLSPNTGDATGLLWMGRAYGVVLYYLFGVGGWAMVAALVLVASGDLERIVRVGYAQYRQDCATAQEEYARLEKVEANRQKRRELRRKLRAEKSGEDTVGALIIGAIIGAFFF